MSCLEGNIIGLSKTTCPCYTDDKPIDAEESQSGLYLDELITLDMIEKAESCEEGTMWDLMKKAIGHATDETEEKLVECVKEKSESRKASCIDTIGGPKYNQATNQNTTYAGLKVTFWNLKGASAIIKAVRTLFASSGTINGQIIFKNSSLPTQTYTWNTTSSVFQANDLTTALETYQYAEVCDNVEMYVIYEVNPSLQPLNNEVDCGCTNKESCWEDFAKVEGVTGNDLNNIQNWQTSSYANGLGIDMTFRCKEENVICDGQIDWQTSQGKNIARAIQYLSAFKVFEKVYYSNKPSIWTTVCKEDLETMLPRLEGKANSYMKEACEGIDIDTTDCFLCKNDWGIKNVRIG